MAKARAECTCSECGEVFIKTADKRNRTEANDWEAWAVNNYTQCPKCWGKEQRKKEAETPMYAEIKLDPYSGDGIVVMGGNTIERKEEIHELHFRWGEEPCSGTFGLLSTTRPKLCWNKIFNVEEIENIISELKTLNITLKNSVSDMDLAVARKISKEKHDKQKELEEKLAEIKKPICPEVLKGHRWNQKVYGKSGSYSIYPDNVKTEISDCQAKEIEIYLKEISEYQSKVEEIKHGKI